MIGFLNKSMDFESFKTFINFIFNGNVNKLNRKGFIRYGSTNKFNDEVVKSAKLDDYILLKDGVVYFTFVKEKGTFYYVFERSH